MTEPKVKGGGGGEGKRKEGKGGREEGREKSYQVSKFHLKYRTYCNCQDFPKVAFIKVIIKEFIELSSQFYFTAHLHIFMTYQEEIKIEAKSILLKLTSVMEGQMVGRELVETGRRVTLPGNPLRGRARPRACCV